MNVSVLTPEKIFFSGTASKVRLEAELGQIEILENHADMISVVRPGALVLETQQGVKQFSLEDGVVQIVGDQISILVKSAA